MKLAVSLSENFPATLEALAAGEINSGHARVIDRVAGKPDYRSEEVILNEARAVPADLLSRYSLRRERVEVRDYTKYQQQRLDRRASITQEPDGSWKLFAHLDYMAGRRISMAWAKMVEAFRREEKADIDNLAQFCPGCHHLVHDCNWQVCRCHRGHYRINAPPDLLADHGTSACLLAQHSPVLRN